MSDATMLEGDDLRAFAQDELDRHTPANQENNGYERCALCHYTRHPCDVYDLAAAVLRLLNRYMPTDAPWWPKPDENVITTEMADDRLDKLPWVKFDTPGPGEPGDASDAT